MVFFPPQQPFTAVKMTLVFFMLCSGLFQTATSNHLRLMVVKNTSSGWNDANDHCSNESSEVPTLYDEDDVGLAQWVMTEEEMPVSGSFWIGLRRDRANNATWSDGAAPTDDPPVKNFGEEQMCLASTNNTWNFSNCSNFKPFMCYNSTGYELIDSDKNWCQAQWHCRRYYTDLVTVTEENREDVLQEGQGRVFWTGLMFDYWQWPRNECSTYRKWTTFPGEECAVLTQTEMKTYGCESTAWRLCSKGHLRVIFVNISKTWEGALDYCEKKYGGMLLIEDDHDQLAVNQQLGYILRGRENHSLWIGLRQSTLFEFWFWKDSIANYMNWVNVTRLPTQQCGAVDPTQEFKWRAEHCWKRLNFLCQAEIHSLGKKNQTQND